jgi:tetratricopeptide (TPR) repeat protein
MNMAEIRFKQVYETSIPNKLRAAYRNEGVKYCIEALKLYPESEKINFLLGMFYSRWEEPDDKKARDHFLKVIESDPMHSDANLALSKLYYKHDNADKARKYAEKAIEADARNESAQKWLKKIEEKGQVK